MSDGSLYTISIPSEEPVIHSLYRKTIPVISEKRGTNEFLTSDFHLKKKANY
jgi:hypothetical protein